MIKRASTILLTLFLLLTSAQVWAEDFVVNFTGSGSGTLEDVDCPSIITLTSSNASLTPQGLVLKGKKTTLTVNFTKASATNKEYSVSVVIASNNNTQFRFIATQSNGNTTYNPTGQEWDYFTGTQSFKTYANGSTASFTIELNDNISSTSTLTLKSIKISGAIEKSIVANKKNVYEGEEVTFTAYGMKAPVKWYFQESGTSTQTEKGTGNSITLSDLRNNGTITAIDSNGDKLSYFVAVGIRCTGTQTPDFVETFKLRSGTEGRVNNLASGLGIRTSYKYYTEDDPIKYIDGVASNKLVNEEEYKIATSTEGTWNGWKEGNSASGNAIKGPKYKDAATDESNGSFLIINCGKKNYNDGQYMFALEIDHKLCTHTTYDFSADVINLCQETGTGKVQVDVLFLAYGVEADNSDSKDPIGKLETGTIQGPSTQWHTFNTSVTTGKYEKVRLYLYNNIQNPTVNSDGTITGNDVGIDNIVFARCTPEIGVYTENPTTTASPKTYAKKCNDGVETVDLYIGNPGYSLNKFMQEGFYVLQYKDATGAWKTIKKDNKEIPSSKDGYIKYTVTLDSNFPQITEFRGIVASEEIAARNLITSDNPGSGGCVSYYKMKGNYAKVEMECTNKSLPPTLSYTAECPKEGQLNLYSTISKITIVDASAASGYKDIDLSSITDPATKKSTIDTYGTITWYKEGETNSINHMQDYPAQGDPEVTYYATFTQTQGGSFTASGKASVKVSVLPGIVITINQDNISGCLNDLSDEASRTFEVTKIEPSTVTNPKYKWYTVNTDGSDGAEITELANKTKYTLTDAGSGTIRLKVEGNAGCPATQTLTYNIADNPKFEYVSTTVPCLKNVKTDGIKVNLIKMSGSSALKFTRTATDKDGKTSTTAFTSFDENGSFKVINYTNEKEYTFVDTYFDASYFSGDFDHENVVKVKYDILLGDESTDCNHKASTEEKEIKDTNDFSLTPSETAINIKKAGEKAEYHICEGDEIKVTSTYPELQPGEYYEWLLNGEPAANAEEDSKTYAMVTDSETTKLVFKAVLKAEEGYESCGGEAEITIIVDKKAEVTVENASLCEDESVTMKVTGNADTYKWTPTTYLSNADIKSPTVTPETDGELKYSIEVKKGVCTSHVNEIEVTVNPLPSIENISVETTEDGQKELKVDIDGNSPYTYSLDDETYGDIPTSLPIGWNTLYVKDTNGCKSFKLFEIEPTPIYPEKYFTPNGDNVNEKWDVFNLNMYPAYIVEIFDRHGKRLFIQKVGSFNTGGANTVEGNEFEGWNGKYNGHDMPSDDYWYLITVEEIRKQYTGHFTLKR